MNFKRVGIAAAGLLAANAIAVGTASAEPPDWYMGLNVGESNLRMDAGGIDDAFSNQGLATSSSLDKHRFAWTLDAGLRLSRWLAVEADYVDLGKFGFNTTVLSPASDSFGGHYTVRGAGVNAVGIVPLPEGFALYGKAGVLRSKAELQPGSSSTAISSESRSRTGAAFGLGASYDISRDVALNVEWNRYLKVGDNATTGRADVDLLLAGVQYRF